MKKRNISVIITLLLMKIKKTRREFIMFKKNKNEGYIYLYNEKEKMVK